MAKSGHCVAGATPEITATSGWLCTHSVDYAPLMDKGRRHVCCGRAVAPAVGRAQAISTYWYRALMTLPESSQGVALTMRQARFAAQVSI